MKISLSADSFATTTADIVVVGVQSSDPTKDALLKKVDRAFGKHGITSYIKDEGFEAKAGQCLKLQTPNIKTKSAVKARWVWLFGLGKEGPTAQSIRRMATATAKMSKRTQSAAIVLAAPAADVADVADAAKQQQAWVQAATEGLINGAYRYAAYKTGKRKPKAGLRSVVLLVNDAKDAKNTALKTAIKHGKAIAESANFVRDLVNAPPNDMHPLALTKAAKKQAETLGLTCKVWNKKALQKEKMELFLAVNKGSAIEPRMVHLAYKPKKAAKATKRVVFVGKGLTFDAGGLCLKPANSMVDMKCDMAGAATTLGIIAAAARIQLPIEIHAVIGTTENMLGAEAYRPGDVYTSRNGKTVEVINTDAEGRMVLADVLSWASELKPDILIDHATLTGACMVGLGPWRAGLYANDDDLAEQYLAAAESEGESYWHMPLDEDLRKSLDSDVADLKHIGGRYGGSITAALFLREFVGKCQWMHLDIAGPAFQDSKRWRYPKGGTGFGVATGVRFLQNLAETT